MNSVHERRIEMKTKKASKTNTSRFIFFNIAITYNLILGFYLRGFLVFSPTLQVFYLLSALPTLFLSVETKTKAMRAAVYILMILIALPEVPKPRSVKLNTRQGVAVEYLPSAI